MNERLNTFRVTARALLLLATLGLCWGAQAEEAGGAPESAAESLLSKNLFSGRSPFSRLSERVHFSGFARLVGGYLDGSS